MRKLIPALTIALIALASSPAFAGNFSPLDNAKATVVTWGGDIGFFIFVGAAITLGTSAHERFEHIFGTIARVVIVIAMICGGGAVLVAWGISQTAAGAWLP